MQAATNKKLRNIFHVYFFSSVLFPFLSQGALVKLCSDIYFRGNCSNISMEYNGTCQEVPAALSGSVSSINTGNMCLNLFLEDGCQGKVAVQLYPGNHNHHDLNGWRFDNQLKSMLPCDKHIYEPNRAEGRTLSVYTQQRVALHLLVDECENLPETWQNRIYSANTQKKCYNFFSDLNCTGESFTTPLLAISFYMDFQLTNFGGRTKSIGICKEEAEKPVVPFIPQRIPLPTGLLFALRSTAATTGSPLKAQPLSSHDEDGAQRDQVTQITVAITLSVMALLLSSTVAFLLLVNNFRTANGSGRRNTFGDGTPFEQFNS